MKDKSKEAIRSLARHCRKSLAEFYEQVHGFPPKAHLLIQSKSPKGYRLDPTINVIPFE